LSYPARLPETETSHTKEPATMNEKQILKAAYDRGKTDAQHGHPGPDQADIADLGAQMLKARGIVDFGDELSPHGNIAHPIDTSGWTPSDWAKHRAASSAAFRDVGDAYARGADAGRRK